MSVNTTERPAKPIPPFCWQSLGDLDHVMTNTPKRDRPYAVAVYIGLTRLASKHRSNSFRATIREIADAGGTRYRKTEDTLRHLQRVGAVGVSGHRDPRGSVYNLRTVCVSTESSMRTPCSELPHAAQVASAPRADSSGDKKEEKRGQPTRVFIRDLESKKTAKQAILDGLVNRYGFTNKDSRAQHAAEWDKCRQLRSEIAELQQRIADFPV